MTWKYYAGTLAEGQSVVWNVELSGVVNALDNIEVIRAVPMWDLPVNSELLTSEFSLKRLSGRAIATWLLSLKVTNLGPAPTYYFLVGAGLS
jgi:hypothetical protein